MLRYKKIGGVTKKNIGKLQGLLRIIKSGSNYVIIRGKDMDYSERDKKVLANLFILL
jgi:hypothetical protein